MNLAAVDVDELIEFWTLLEIDREPTTSCGSPTPRGMSVTRSSRGVREASAQLIGKRGAAALG